MKTKMKIVALVLVLSVALTGAGYAAWGSKITANTTLNTGEWEVVLENDYVGHSLVAGDVVNYYNASDNTATGTRVADNELPNFTQAINPKYQTKNSGNISGANKGESTNYVYTIQPQFDPADPYEVGFEFYNLHPGSKAVTTYEIRNNGSIPAKFKAVDISVTDKDGEEITSNSPAELLKLYNSIVVSGTVFKHFSNESGASDDFEGATPVNFSGKKLSELEGYLTELLVDDELMLLPRTQVTVLDSDEMELHNFAFEIPFTALNGEEADSEMLKVSITYDFIQYNAMVEEAE